MVEYTDKIKFHKVIVCLLQALCLRGTDLSHFIVLAQTHIYIQFHFYSLASCYPHCKMWQFVRSQ